MPQCSRVSGGDHHQHVLFGRDQELDATLSTALLCSGGRREQRRGENQAGYDQQMATARRIRFRYRSLCSVPRHIQCLFVFEIYFRASPSGRRKADLSARGTPEGGPSARATGVVTARQSMRRLYCIARQLLAVYVATPPRRPFHSLLTASEQASTTASA